MSYGAIKRKEIPGEPINGEVAEKVLFAGGISPYNRVVILKIMYMFPDGFTYKDLEGRFDVTRRHLYRYVENMKDLGLITKVAEGTWDNPARYKFNEQWQ